jgi:hypothetical protein
VTCRAVPFESITNTWVTPSIARMRARPAADVSSAGVGSDVGLAVVSWLADSLGTEGELDCDDAPAHAVTNASRRMPADRSGLKALSMIA